MLLLNNRSTLLQISMNQTLVGTLHQYIIPMQTPDNLMVRVINGFLYRSSIDVHTSSPGPD